MVAMSNAVLSVQRQGCNPPQDPTAGRLYCSAKIAGYWAWLGSVVAYVCTCTLGLWGLRYEVVAWPGTAKCCRSRVLTLLHAAAMAAVVVFVSHDRPQG